MTAVKRPSFGAFLIAFIFPPGFFFSRKRIAAGIVSLILLVVSIPFFFLFGLGIFIWFANALWAMWSLSSEARSAHILEQAQAIAAELNPQIADSGRNGATAHAVAVLTEPRVSFQSERPVPGPGLDPQATAKQQVYRIRISKEPDNVAILGEYGDFLARVGNVDEALVQYFTIVELNSEDMDTRYKIVELYKIQNNIPAATDQLHQILQKRPEDQKAQEKLSKLITIPQNMPSGSQGPPKDKFNEPEPFQESLKTEGTNKNVLLIGGAAGAAILILAAFFFLNQKQGTNFHNLFQSNTGKLSDLAPTPRQNPSKSPTKVKESMKTLPQEDRNISSVKLNPSRELTAPEASDLVINFYNNRGQFAGTYVIDDIEWLKVDTIKSGNHWVHVKYRYKAIPGNIKGTNTSVEEQKTFVVVWNGKDYEVTGIQ